MKGRRRMDGEVRVNHPKRPTSHCQKITKSKWPNSRVSKQPLIITGAADYGKYVIAQKDVMAKNNIMAVNLSVEQMQNK